jgi:hypothetical protein
MAVYLYEDDGLQGSYEAFEESDSDLTDDPMTSSESWNDQASSLWITEDAATFYEDIDNGGRSWELEPGAYDLQEMEAAGIPNDAISSFTV